MKVILRLQILVLLSSLWMGPIRALAESARTSRVPFSRLELKVGQRKRLAGSFVGGVRLEGGTACRLERDSFSDALFLVALTPGRVRLRLEGLSVPAERVVDVLVVEKSRRANAKPKKRDESSPLHLPGWES